MVAAQSPLVCHGHSRPIVELQFSTATEDGVFLISASKDGKPMLRNGETGDWIGTFEGHKGAVWSACLNAPATHAATASADFSARVWDAIKGEELFNFAHKHIVRTVAFSQDSKRLLTGGHEKLLRIFDLMAPNAPPSLLEGSPGPIRTSHWLHNDTLLLVACNDTPGVSIWDLRTKKVVATLDTGGDAVGDVQPCGRLLVAAAGKTVRTWDATTFVPIGVHALDFPVYTAAASPAKGRFVAAGADMWPRLFELATGAELECNKGHHGPVHAVRFHRAYLGSSVSYPDPFLGFRRIASGESYASGSEDGTIRLWSSTTAAEAAAAATSS